MDERDVEEELLLVETELQDVQDQIKALLEQQERLQERKYELRSLIDGIKAYEDAEASAAAPMAAEDWSRNFNWDSRAEDARFNIFGISSYRSNQKQIINAVMSGRDVLVIMAAGGGKSLCYQLPAILHEGITLVISPLLSLIQDQVMGLTVLGIPAYMLTSNTNKEIEKFIYKAIEKGDEQLKILYVTPEKISKSKRFMSKLEKCHKSGRLSLIAIDEAHCCSQWGHDFRPDYKNLGILKIQFPNVPLIALTATATNKVQMDLIEMLHIPKSIKFVSTVNRPNLLYKVYEKSSVGKIVIEEIADYIKRSYSNNESGIVYCFSRKECEQVAKELRDYGISADYYHADMDVLAREKVHLRWSKSKLQVIVGGIWDGNQQARWFVIHHSLSKSMETYYQESGRAGRDGLPSECILYYRPADVSRQSSMVFYENCGLQNLYDMVRYCQSRRICRRNAFFRHFGETSQDCNGMCDNCAYAFEIKEIDATRHASILVSQLQEIQKLDQRATMLQLFEKCKLKMKELDFKKEEIEQLIIQLILDRVLKEEFQHTPYTTNAYLVLGPLWKQALNGKMAVKLEIRVTQQSKNNNNNNKNINNNNNNNEGSKRKRKSGLENKLEDLRKGISSEHGGIFPHSVLSLQQISILSTQKPTSLEEVERLIGKVKTEKYGARIINVILDYINSDNEDDFEYEENDGNNNNNNKKHQKKGKSVVTLESSDEDNCFFLN